MTVPLRYLQALSGTFPSIGQAEPMQTLEEAWRKPPVALEQINPKEEEIERFLAERDELYDQFLSLNDGQLLEKTKIPNGELLIRSVAKKSGIQDFREVEIFNKTLKITLYRFL